MKIIKLNNKYYIEGNVIMLPTNNKSKLFIGEISGLLQDLAIADSDDSTLNQELYITIDENINKGDWFICSDIIKKCVERKKYANDWYLTDQLGNEDCVKFCKKIIVSTKDLSDNFKLSASFIKEYAERWNKGNKNNNVLIEVEYTMSADSFDNNVYYNGILINTDNTINIIFKEEKKYNKDEVIKLCKIAHELGNAWGDMNISSESKEVFDNFIKEI
jgi:small nuclear ribonucleoprotein (snRNP)-like protein